MPCIFLVKPDTGSDLGYHLGQQIRKAAGLGTECFSDDHSAQLRGDTLHRNLGDPRCIPVYGRSRLRFYVKAKDRGKAHGPEDTEDILLKPGFGIPDAADDAFLQVFFPAIQIHKTLPRMISHGIDGKISARQILGDILYKGHLIRMTSVGVFSVRTEGRDLIARFAAHNGHGTVL